MFMNFSLRFKLDQNMSQKYSGRLFPLEAGQLITVSGKTSAAPERFEVELSSDNGAHGSTGDVQFHMSVRFNGAGEIVRNAHTRGVGWGHEERHENLFPNNTANPIRRGANFKIAIFIDSSIFFVSIDDKPFCMFPHRKPLHEVQKLKIHRDVETIYQVDHITAQPHQWPMRNETVFSSLVPKQFKAGNIIVLSAITRGVRGDFAVNLRDEKSNKILFHLRPYIGNGTIVTNDQDANGG